MFEFTVFQTLLLHVKVNLLKLRSFVPGRHSLMFTTHLFYGTDYLQANYPVLRLLRTRVLLSEVTSRFLG